MFKFTLPPPLTLYIHIPWCIKKCPYCDFNSHEPHSTLPENDYILALLHDLEQSLPLIWGRKIRSIFIGGGTPSLFSATAINHLLEGIRARVPVSPLAEITLEANPGSLNAMQCQGYKDAGINRLSIGAQSFDDACLQALGRIHHRADIIDAVAIAQQAGFNNINLDLMFALPQQTPAMGLSDIHQAIELQPTHISYYQLTIEPNTFFHQYPPVTPPEDMAWDIQQQGIEALSNAGYLQYETSAFSQPNQSCWHNLNYWTFGDYLGIGAGAHSKITDMNQQSIQRTWRIKHPQTYLDQHNSAQYIAGSKPLTPQDVTLEFMMNALRLEAGFAFSDFTHLTGIDIKQIEAALDQAEQTGFITINPSTQTVTPTAKGKCYLNDLLLIFNP